ncbi:hypothetical protein BGZ89_009603 [Linnemannia elongata]|nr:hypothetical protein BGZ89_009603 [Linnemannia elongata]
MFSVQLSAIVYSCLLWSASAVAPAPAYSSAYATVDENTFYIQGGANVSNIDIKYDQFHSLDLTQNWNVTNPPWSAVAVGTVPARLKTAYHSTSLSRDRKTMTFWNIYSLSFYSINYHLDTNAWDDVSIPQSLQPSGLALARAATDSTTDRVYIPGGASNNSMLMYDPSSKNSTGLANPPANMTGTVPPVLAGSCMVPGQSYDTAGNPALLPETLGIYNINTTQWMDTFIAKIKPTPKPTTTTTARPTGTGSAGVTHPTTGTEPPNESNKAAIIGGSVGGGLFLILLIVGGLCFWRRRRNNAQQHQTKEMEEEQSPTKKFQFRIVQQPETESTVEPTFYPSRPFRITPNNSQRKSNKKQGQEPDDDLSYYFHSHGGAPSPTRSEESFSSSAPSTATSTLEDDVHPTNVTNTTLLPQHIITLKPSERQRHR